MKRTALALIIFVTIGVQSVSRASTDSCARLLGGFNKPVEPTKNAKVIDGTDGFIGYLGQLLDQQLIGRKELQLLADGIEQRSEISNPVPHEVTQYGVLFTRSAYQIHYEELEEYIRHSRLDQKKLLAWAMISLKEKERVREKREETRVETQDVHQKTELHRVEKGDFQMGEGNHKVKVTLSHPFEAMSTAVTQKMWVDEMEDNPSKFQDGEQTAVVNRGGKQIKMQPDNPVEQVTWWSAITYANRLSVKMNLPPAYDLNQITDWEGSAELGTLKPRDEGKAKAALKINAPNGNIYEAQGFRLPTEAEQEYLRTDRGRSPGKYFSGVDENNLKDHAWYSDNSKTQAQPNGSTHPVAQLSAQIIDGKDFYDLHGNVWEWGNDSWDGSEALKGGTDPRGSSAGSFRVVRGGGWSGNAGVLRSAYRRGGTPGGRDGSVGFRLVRTAK